MSCGLHNRHNERPVPGFSEIDRGRAGWNVRAFHPVALLRVFGRGGGCEVPDVAAPSAGLTPSCSTGRMVLIADQPAVKHGVDQPVGWTGTSQIFRFGQRG